MVYTMSFDTFPLVQKVAFTAKVLMLSFLPTNG